MTQDTILLVEDDSDEAYLATLALESTVRARVVHVRDGAEALKFFQEPGTDTANTVVMLLDLKLPRIGGLDVLKALRSEPRTKLLPVVILTNSRADEDVTAAYTNGCNSYVRKQVDWVEFKETIRRVGEYWLTINEKLPRRSVS